MAVQEAGKRGFAQSNATGDLVARHWAAQNGLPDLITEALGFHVGTVHGTSNSVKLHSIIFLI